MLRKILAKQIGFRIQDLIKGTSILDKYFELRKSQFWDEGKVYDYQLHKLKSLIKYSSKYVPYYESLFEKIKLSHHDIKSLDDISKVPILTKEILRISGDDLLSREFKKFKVKYGKTGGTTGVPVKVFKDEQNRSFTWGSYYRWYDWMGVNYYDHIVTLWGASTVFKHSFKNNLYNMSQQFIQNESVFSSFELDNKNMDLIARRIRFSKSVLLKGYLSALLEFAHFVEKNNYKLDSIKAISSTTETLLPHNRKYLEKVFNAKVFDQYGCGEVSAISYECSAHNGLHINQEHVICEVLNDSNKNILNSSGRVVATDLDNYVMPFIRYENGDLATLSDKKCTCGINQPLMKSINGRTIDTVVLNNGRKVHGVFFTDILYELEILTDKIQRFQIFQDIPGSIEFRIETKESLSSNVKDEIEKAFLFFLDKVNIVEFDKIPNSKSGKFSYIISEI